MRYCEYIQMLHNYIGADRTHADFVIFITDTFLKEPKTEKELDEENNSQFNPLDRLNQRTLERIYIAEGNRKISKKDARILKSKYYSGNFESMIKCIENDLQERFIADLKNFGYKARKNNFEKIASNVYYDLLTALAEGKDQIEPASENISTIKQASVYDAFDEDSLIDAKAFIIEHSGELALLPLCQIVANVNPLKKHVRKMFNDYLLLKENARKNVLKQANLEEYVYNADWLMKAIQSFEKDIDNNNLRRDRNLLYDGAKYLHRALEYSPKEIIDSDPYVFEMPLNSDVMKKMLGRETIYITIGRYIELYIESSCCNMYEPLDYLWQVERLSNCSQETMCFWVMRFIVSACLEMPLKKYGDSEIIEEFHLETMEDFYYYALLQLYKRYQQPSPINHK